MDEESRNLFHSGRLIFIGEVSGKVSTCNFCGRESSTSKPILVKDIVKDQSFTFGICDSCGKEVLLADSYEKLFGVTTDGFLSMKEDWEKVPSSVDSLLNTLKEKQPTFLANLAKFTYGEVKYEDGSQHEFLQSIAAQVIEKGKYPSEAQISGFNKVFSFLEREKRDKGFLRRETPDEVELRNKTITHLLTIAQDNLSLFTGATKPIINSMASQFRDKKTLTPKQVSYLTYIVEQLPKAILARY